MADIRLIVNLIVGLSIFAVVAAVAVDFTFFQEKRKERVIKKSPVATFTMFCFFFMFYAIEKNGWGVLEVGNYQVRVFMIAAGLALMVTGAYVNIAGRFKLGGNWSDHIKIYLGHTMVSDGVYALVRHPLYASLIWMFYGSALIYSNGLAFLANTLIFVPAMYYRAKQEERFLIQEFFAYKDYQREVGMFLPKIKNKKKK